jgi:muscarinic acetylcholine receptor
MSIGYNSTHRLAAIEQATPYTTWQVTLLGLGAACTSLVTIGGNLIVILSFVLERSIRQPSNYFIASLAVSDLLIGVCSMPLYTTYILSVKTWPLGEVLCDLWLSIDYTACLCSIYTVFCITVDRFCSIKQPAKYRVWRTECKVCHAKFLISTFHINVFYETSSCPGTNYILRQIFDKVPTSRVPYSCNF